MSEICPSLGFFEVSGTPGRSVGTPEDQYVDIFMAFLSRWKGYAK